MKTLHTIILGVLGSVIAYYAIHLFVAEVTVLQYIIIEIVMVLSLEFYNLAVRNFLTNHVSNEQDPPSG